MIDTVRLHFTQVYAKCLSIGFNYFFRQLMVLVTTGIQRLRNVDPVPIERIVTLMMLFSVSSVQMNRPRPRKEA